MPKTTKKKEKYKVVSLPQNTITPEQQKALDKQNKLSIATLRKLNKVMSAPKKRVSKRSDCLACLHNASPHEHGFDSIHFTSKRVSKKEKDCVRCGIKNSADN